MKLLDWGPHSKWMIAGLSTIGTIAIVVILWEAGIKAGVVDPYAWLNWKASLVMGLTQNPGYLFLIIHTILLGTIAWYAGRVYKLLKKGWHIDIPRR